LGVFSSLSFPDATDSMTAGKFHYQRFGKMSVLLFVLLVLSKSPAFAVVITNNFPPQIVNCQDGVDVDALIKEYSLTPKYIFRYALNGFAAPMSRTEQQCLPAAQCGRRDFGFRD
jgi:hypothetical protein